MSNSSGKKKQQTLHSFFAEPLAKKPRVESSSSTRSVRTTDAETVAAGSQPTAFSDEV